MKEKDFSYKILFTAVFLWLVLIGIGYKGETLAASVWKEPSSYSQNPPNQNFYPPDVVHAGLELQTKPGDLTIGALLSTGGGQFESLKVARSTSILGGLNTESVRVDNIFSGKFCLGTSCIASWKDAAALGGQADRLSKWKDESHIEDSSVVENNTQISIGSNVEIAGNLNVNNNISGKSGIVLKKFIGYVPPATTKSKLALSVDAGGNVILVKLAGSASSCTPTSPIISPNPCTTNWGACDPTSRKKTRSCPTVKTNADCSTTAGTQIEKTGCVPPPPVCTPSEVVDSATCGSWSACDVNDKKTRVCGTIITGRDCTTSSGSKVEIGQCAVVPPVGTVNVSSSCISGDSSNSARVSISWSLVPGATSYRLEKALSSDLGNWTFLDNYMSNSGSDTIRPTGSYMYRVRAINGNQVSSYVVSSIAASAVSCVPVGMPRPFFVSIGRSCGAGTLGILTPTWHWDGPLDPLKYRYRLYRCDQNFSCAPTGSWDYNWPMGITLNAKTDTQSLVGGYNYAYGFRVNEIGTSNYSPSAISCYTTAPICSGGARRDSDGQSVACVR
ncbi:hypothetical protein HY948_03480 [Candidatus Gottesmanbacteria bacterium]|nr:hypothetical protein [Candidatus Gottesmanbacteria bacterium]